MGRKFPTNCKECGERILMVLNRGGRWRALDFPESSLSGSWSGHVHMESKKWVSSRLDNDLGGEL